MFPIDIHDCCKILGIAIFKSFTSMINEKTGLVSKNELDSASDEIMRVFNSLYQYYAKTLAK